MEYLTREKMDEELNKAQQPMQEEPKEQIEQAEETPEELPEQTEPQAQQEEEKRLASLEKALKDTKAWATKLAQENAALKKAVEELIAGTGTQQQVDEAKQAFEKTQQDFLKAKEKIYEDYPEFRDILDPLFEKSVQLERKLTEIEQLKKQIEEEKYQKSAIEYFNTYVKPEILKVHPDFDEIVLKDGQANEEYFQWAMQQSPALQYAALHSNDPRDIIFAITEYKKYKHTPEAIKAKEKIEKEKIKKYATAMAMRSQNTAVPEYEEPLSEEEMPIEEWIKKRNKEKFGR